MTRFTFDIEHYQKLQIKHIQNHYKPEFKNAYDSYLDDVRNYLDNCEMYMPIEKYPFRIRDKSTWRYLDSRQIDKSSTQYHCIDNPYYRYDNVNKLISYRK